jgi:hypothetical protein
MQQNKDYNLVKYVNRPSLMGAVLAKKCKDRQTPGNAKVIQKMEPAVST